MRCIGENPSPNGRGRPAPAGRVRGTASIKAILFICTPHPPLRGTLSRWERDSQIHTLILKISLNPHSRSPFDPGELLPKRFRKLRVLVSPSLIQSRSILLVPNAAIGAGLEQHFGGFDTVSYTHLRAHETG